MDKKEVEDIGHAISTVIQTRYVWLTNHISRITFLNSIDNPNFNSPLSYSFSEEDHKNGIPPIDLKNHVELLKTSSVIFAHSNDGRRYDYNYVREITLTSLRSSFLISVQSYFEFYRIIDICKKHKLKGLDLFDFIRQARNVVCHGNGLMNSNRLTRCQWRHLIIENNGSRLKITDHLLHEIVNEAIKTLIVLYVDNGGEVDYVSLNLGYTIPFVQTYVSKNNK